MNDSRKTKAQLITELERLRRLVAEREQARPCSGKTEPASDVFATLGKNLNAASTFAAAARIALDAASELIGWDACTFDMYSRGDDTVNPILNIDTIGGKRVDVPPLRFGVEPTARMRRVLVEGPLLLLREKPCTPETGSLLFGDTSRPSASIMAVSIQNDLEPIAIVSVQSYSENAYDHQTLKKLEALADYCGGALERMLAEKQRRESEARYRYMIETAQEGIWMVDADANTTYVNQHLAKMLGYSRDEMLCRSALNFVHDEDRQEARRYLERGREGYKGYRDFRFRRKDGSDLWTLVSTSPVYDDGGGFIGGLAMLIDITERRKAEYALKESEARLHAAFENLPVDFWVRDTSGRYIIQNAYSILQWGNKAGMRLQEVAPDPETLALWEDHHRRALADEVVKAEFEVPGGEQAGYYYGVVAPIRVDGEVHGVLGVNIDITDRKRAEEALRQSEAKFRALTETTAAAIFIYEGSRLVYVNPTTRLHTGYDREELLATSFWDVVHPEFRDLVRERGLARQRGESIPPRYEFKILTKTGETRWVDATASPLEYEGRPAAIGTAFDITDRKRAEEALRETQEQLHHVLLYSPALVYSLRVDGEDLSSQWISARLTQMTGYAPDEALSKDWWIDHIHPGDRERVMAGLPRLFADDRLVHEYRFRHKNKGYVWLHDEIRLLRDESGKPVEAIGSWIDVTERREAELALRDSEERFRTLVSSMDDVVFTVDLEQRYSGAFGRWLEKFEIDRGNLIGLTASEILGGEAGRIHEESNARGLSGEQVVYEFTMGTRKGPRDFQVSLSPIHDHSRKVTGLVGVGRDITERKRSEEQIHFQASLLDQVRNAVIAIDLKQNVVLWNSFAESLFQVTRAEALGRNIVDLVVPDDRRDAGEYVIRSIKETGFWEGEFVVRRKDGSTFPSYFHCAAIRGIDGRVTEMVGVGADITERKRLDRTLWESEDRFRSFMAHLPGYAWIKNIDGSYVYLNERLRETLSHHQDDWHGRTDAELFPLEIASGFQRNDQLVMRTRQALQVVEPWTWKGEPRYALVNKFPIFDAQGEIFLIAGASVDITDLKQAEEELRRQKEILQKIFDHIPVMIRFRGQDGRIKLVNEEWQRTLGWTLDDILQRDKDILAEAYPDPNYRQQVYDFISAATGEWADFQTRVKDGRVIDTTWASVCLSDGTTVGFGLDITERKRASELLQRQAAQLAALHEIEMEIGAERDLPRVLDVVTRRAGELLRASHCSTYIKEKEETDLRIVASLDPDLIGLRLKSGEGLAGRVAVTGCAQAIEDYRSWPGRASMYDAKKFGPSLGAPLKWQQTIIGIISMSREQGEEPFTPEDSRLLEQIAAEAAIAIHQATLFEEVQDAKKRLQVLSHRLIDAQEAERQRLARDLHDQIGQALTAVQISLQAVQSSSGNSAGGRVQDSLAIIDEALQQVHDLSLDLRPSLLDHLGLVAALRWYVDRVASRAGLLKCFNAEDLDTRQAPQIETACFRIAQEALTNVVRHAHAGRIWVRVVQEKDVLQLVVRDDGVGFDVREALSRTGHNASLGLQGMQERAVAVGGMVAIRSNLGKGAQVQASFPRKPASPIL